MEMKQMNLVVDTMSALKIMVGDFIELSWHDKIYVIETQLKANRMNTQIEYKLGNKKNDTCIQFVVAINNYHNEIFDITIDHSIIGSTSNLGSLLITLEKNIMNRLELEKTL